MTDPRTFIGQPDWRSAVVAALFALPWLVAFSRGHLRRWQLWGALAAAAGLFPISIAWVQVPIQQGLNLFWRGLLGVAAIQRYLLAVAVPSIVVSGLVQESAKLLVAWLGLRLSAATRRPAAGVALGAAAGAGYGGFEAFWVFNQIFASGITWGTVQLYGPAALLGFVERFFAVPFHIGAAVLSAYGLASGRPWRFLLLAAALHSLANYGAILLQAGLLDALSVELWVAGVAAVTAGLAFALWKRSVRPAAEQPARPAGGSTPSATPPGAPS